MTQIDGTALSCPTAVAVGADGSVYFTDAAAVSPKHGVESALRTELVAHTGTGSVYVYEPRRPHGADRADRDSLGPLALRWMKTAPSTSPTSAPAASGAWRPRPAA